MIKFVGSPKQREWAKSIVAGAAEEVRVLHSNFEDILVESTWYIANRDLFEDVSFWRTLTTEQASDLNEQARQERLARSRKLPEVATRAAIESVVIEEISDLLSKVAFIEGRSVTATEAVKFLIEVSKPEIKRRVSAKNAEW